MDNEPVENIIKDLNDPTKPHVTIHVTLDNVGLDLNITENVTIQDLEFLTADMIVAYWNMTKQIQNQAVKAGVDPSAFLRNIGNIIVQRQKSRHNLQN